MVLTTVLAAAALTDPTEARFRALETRIDRMVDGCACVPRSTGVGR
jgi:hypothetical protein